MLKSTHASIVHDNIGDFDTAELRDLLRFVGYRYTLKQATYTPNLAPGSTIELSTQWVNSGYAPAYPRMGEDFELSFLLVDSNNNVVQEWQSSADLSLWMPAATITGTAPINLIKQSLELDRRLATGSYELKTAVIDRRSNKAIYLANERRRSSGRLSHRHSDDCGRFPVNRSSTPCAHLHLNRLFFKQWGNCTLLLLLA